MNRWTERFLVMAKKLLQYMTEVISQMFVSREKENMM